jgi:hypothetical protein
MKIILIYTPRSGSTSILKYFSKLKPDYKCYNEPWFQWMIQNVHHKEIKYDELILQENIFVKSAFKTLPVPIEQIVKDFDKVIFLLRKNIQEQIESSIYVRKTEGYLNHSQRKYWINSDDDEIQSEIARFKFLNQVLMGSALHYNKPLFYYEDLYYNDFSLLFNELGVEYNIQYFDKYLNTNKRYRSGSIETKKIRSTI